MSSKRLILPLLGAALLSACAAKKQALPPTPPAEAAPPAASTAPTTTTTIPGDSPVGTTNVPGSVADFVAQAGSDKVLFGYDSYDLDDEARAILGKQAEWLARYPQIRVTIEGHTDDRGTREYNLALGDRRANAARNFLAAQGVAASRMTVLSYGKERPAVDGSDDAAWAQNRRAVTVIAAAR
jgi:peptidoglycan-associated lipoprotein